MPTRATDERIASAIKVLNARGNRHVRRASAGGISAP